MRVSTDENDPGYAPLLIGGAKVFFAGYEIDRVFMADEEQRKVVVAAVDDAGKFVVKDGEVKRETLYGDVRIECDPGALANHVEWTKWQPKR